MMKVLNIVCLDTNILVYRFDKSSPFHGRAVRLFDEISEKNRRCVMSSQAISEFISVMTNVRSYLVKVSDAWEFLYELLDSEYFKLIYPNSKTVEIFRNISVNESRRKTAVFDQFLAATLLSNGINTLITENVKDFEGIKNFKAITMEQFLVS